MASAMETLITACLKYFGYTRQQLDEAIVTGKHELDTFRNRAVSSEQRMERIERMVSEQHRRVFGSDPVGAQVGTEDRASAHQIAGTPATDVADQHHPV